MTTMRVVGECFFWCRLTRVFPDKFHRAVKRLCVYVYCFRTVLFIKITCEFTKSEVGFSLLSILTMGWVLARFLGGFSLGIYLGTRTLTELWLTV